MSRGACHRDVTIGYSACAPLLPGPLIMWHRPADEQFATRGLSKLFPVTWVVFHITRYTDDFVRVAIETGGLAARIFCMCVVYCMGQLGHDIPLHWIIYRVHRTRFVLSIRNRSRGRKIMGSWCLKIFKEINCCVAENPRVFFTVKMNSFQSASFVPTRSWMTKSNCTNRDHFLKTIGRIWSLLETIFKGVRTVSLSTVYNWIFTLSINFKLSMTFEAYRRTKYP